jgi:hypothetical protein
MKTTWLLLITFAVQSITSQKYCEQLVKTRIDESELILELGKNMHVAKAEANRYICQ